MQRTWKGFLAGLILFCASASLFAQERFDFSPADVEANWQGLTGGMRGPFPSPEALRREADRYPGLLDETLEVLRQHREHPKLDGLALDLSDADFRIISGIVVEAWTALFNGDFEQAWRTGSLVGPPGMFPALYARALQAQYLEQDADEKERLLREVMEETARLLEKQPDHDFARFGHAYAKSRLLEPMGALAARMTGYMDDVQDILDDLLADDPDNLYALTLQGGLYSGIIDKAGKWLAERRFDVTPAMVDQVFQRAIERNQGYASPYLEYALAMQRVWKDERENRIHEMLSLAAAVTPVSAEEALVVGKAREQLRVTGGTYRNDQ